MSFENYLMRATAFCIVAMTFWVPLSVQASQLDEVMDAGEEGANYFEGALTGLYQSGGNSKIILSGMNGSEEVTFSKNIDRYMCYLNGSLF